MIAFWIQVVLLVGGFIGLEAGIEAGEWILW